MPKISGLPSVSVSLLTDIFPVVQSGTTVQESLSQVLTLFNSNIVIGVSQVTNLASDLDARLISSNNLSDLNSASNARTNLGLGTASTASSSSFLQVTNNLSDLNSASIARTNLGLGTAATDSANSFLQVANNLSDLNSASTARTHLGLGTAATASASSFLLVANNLNDLADKSTALVNLGALSVSENLSDLNNASTARTNLGLGTAAIASSSSFLQVSNNLSDLNNAGTARTNLGLGSASTHPDTYFLQVLNNLSDINNASTARTNLGVPAGSGNSTGTNTGDQTITLTSDVTGSGTGSFATTIASNAITTAKINNSAVTYAKIQSMTTVTLLGNPTGGGAAPSEITLGTGLSFTGSVLNVTSGTGTVNSSTANYLAYYATTGTAVSGVATVNNGIVVMNGSGVPSCSTTAPVGITLPQPLIQGVTDGSSASTGNVGQVVSSTILSTSPVSLTGGTAKDITSITLGAGDWDVYGNVSFATGTAAICQAWTSLNSATLPNLALVSETITNSFALGLVCPYLIVRDSMSTTVYLSAKADNSINAYGSIFARRVR